MSKIALRAEGWPIALTRKAAASRTARKDVARSRTMVDFMRWALADGQKYVPELGYAPLPEDVVKLELQALDRIKA